MRQGKIKPGFLYGAVVAVGLTILVFSIYSQTGTHPFLSYDDDIYIVKNHSIQTGINISSLQWAFTSTYASNYHPLTWISHMLDYHLFGLDAGAHHITNVVLHNANSVLLFFLFRLMTGTFWRPVMLATLFACHPLHVESVAWISERKDLLSTLFLILTLIRYHFYVQNRNWHNYILVLLFFTAGLLAKPMLVTLPFCLLLLDHWPYGRWSLANNNTVKLISEKIPLFIIALLSCIITIYAQKQGNSVVGLTEYQFLERVSNALSSYVVYMNKTIWPNNLAIFYPYPDSIQIPQMLGATGVLLLISYFAVMRTCRQPYFAVGWFWYLGTMIPIIGLVQVGEQAMADRYTYVPSLGLFIILIWGTYDFLVSFLKGKNVTPLGLKSLILIVPIIYSVISFQQVGYWKSDLAIFNHAIEVTDNNYLAHFQLGTAYARENSFKKAESHLRETLRLKPGTALAYNNLAYVLERKGNIKEAIDNYQQSANLAPNNKEAHYNLGLLYLRKWQLEKSIHHLEKVLEIEANDPMAIKNLAKAKKMRSALQK